MATNQRQNIRQIRRPQASIAGLTQTQILQLIQSETTAGTEADVGGLQVGDMVVVTPSDVPALTIAPAHGQITAGQGEVVARVFFVTAIFNDVPATVPANRHVLTELLVAPAAFW